MGRSTLPGGQGWSPEVLAAPMPLGSGLQVPCPNSTKGAGRPMAAAFRLVLGTAECLRVVQRETQHRWEQESRFPTKT